MRIDALTLEGFRNYDRQSLTFHDSCNVIYGENAQGKTNLLEAMVYLSCGKSPRARADRELIGFDRDKAYILGQMFTRDREFRTEVELFRGRRRKASVNGVPAKNNAALSDVLHTVFFSPEDLMLIREGAAARRRFMDLSLCQLRPRYGEALAEYHRLYEHKTRILRDSGDYPQLLATLPDFNRRLCQVGAVEEEADFYFRNLWLVVHSLSTLIVTGDCPYRDQEIGQILTGFSLSTCKAIKEIPGFASGAFDRDAVFRALVQE